jgi:hypothetical protein
LGSHNPATTNEAKAVNEKDSALTSIFTLTILLLTDIPILLTSMYITVIKKPSIQKKYCVIPAKKNDSKTPYKYRVLFSMKHFTEEYNANTERAVSII